jgi:hypothetical protein
VKHSFYAIEAIGTTIRVVSCATTDLLPNPARCRHRKHGQTVCSKNRMCVEVTMCRVHLRLCSAIVLSSIPLCTLDFEVKVDTLIDVEGEWVEIVLDHVWVEAEHRWLDAWMEMNRHRQLFEGMLLVCSDLFDSGSRSNSGANMLGARVPSVAETGVTLETSMAGFSTLGHCTTMS